MSIHTSIHMQVDILVAIYRPHMAYLRVQLESLNAQDYPHLRVLLLDDSADEETHAHIATLAEQTLTAHPYRLFRNEKNLGVTGTFQKLTQLSEADLLAYCDQDDKWLPEKISRLVSLCRNPDITAAYSNLAIMDGQGRTIHPTLQAMNPRFTHKSGANLFPYFLQDNCVTGCTLLVRREVAQSALPFPAAYVHDQWLALCAAARGGIAYDPAPLIRYRLHGGNVIGMASLSGVTDRSSYVSARLRPQMAMLEAAGTKFTASVHQKEIARQQKALRKRIDYIDKRRLYLLPALLGTLWRDPLRLGLEALLGVAPQSMGEKLISFAKHH